LTSLPDYGVAAYLLDTYVEGALPGGNGTAFAWELAGRAKLQEPIILAGGLTPENIEAAIAQVRPDGVDVSSGVEQRPGVKDGHKMRQFIARAKAVVVQKGHS
jgi:phosphoribosylanthranilate isomerase